MSTLSSVGPPDCTASKRPNHVLNHVLDGATFDVLPSQDSSIVQIENSLLLVSVVKKFKMTAIHSPTQDTVEELHSGM